MIEKSIDALKIPGYLLMSWVPLQPISQIMADLAGKDTQVNVALSATVAWSVVASGGWAYSANKSRQRKKRLQDARTRTDSLEGRLLALDPKEEARSS